jgi:hypothetical protein
MATKKKKAPKKKSWSLFDVAKTPKARDKKRRAAIRKAGG